MYLYQGSGVAVATPFNADKSVNFAEFARLVEFQIENGTAAIIVCGTTGEGSTLSADERNELIAHAAKTAAGRAKIIGGTGANSTDTAISNARGAQKAGADGLMIVTPYYNRATQGGLIAHYTAIAKAVDLPIILYNVPSRTGMNMEASTMAELAKIPNIVGVKEAAHDIAQAGRIAAICDDNFALYAGNDIEIVPLMALGAQGVISTMANIAPRQIADIVRLCLAGDWAAARKIQLSAIPLIDALFIENNPIPAKAALALMGYNPGGHRLPLTDITPPNLEILRTVMQKYGLI
ncbi:MAG: 4-hydroxy-tetrahydrodipicolinate synthase [Defluviitaleaceae bacterium]|nr:4-hydroxy-tetrahydrodipicolinate synthase [Defluviitaleaceae bacterium]